VLPNSERTYHDPLHGAIALSNSDPTEALLIRLIDTPPFQRLRRIRQLGAANLTFHGAECSRFTHSLGVMAIARRAFDRLAKAYPQLMPHRPVILCAALMHDIGHGPFSHTGEDIFVTSHESWTERILRESEPISKLLTHFQPDLLDKIIQVYRHSYPIPLVWQLVTSQLDCDRLDYLMRDSYFTGATYGKIDLDRIIMAMRYDPVSQQLAVARKGMAAVEHYLLVRYFMYAQVYNHPKNIAAVWVLEQAIARARELLAAGLLVADEVVKAWLSPAINPNLPLEKYLSLESYLAADDTTFFYHLQRWQQSEDPILADLCRRFMDRDLPKAIDISSLDTTEQAALLQQVQTWLTKIGWQPLYYTGIRVSLSRGYTLYQRGIKVCGADNLAELNQLSPLVQTLTTPYERAWLIYPQEVEAQLYTILPPTLFIG